ncbi:MAG: ABC transporter ATP-binding protein [Chloroflexi bacterium]|nr:ABC transporter ATP-binding protein [Chloroflexota bacterium]
MGARGPRHPGGSNRGGGVNFAGLRRAGMYLFRYRKIAAIAYISLFVSTGAMLMVPQLVQSTIDIVTNGVLANTILKLPAPVQAAAQQKLGLSAAQMQSNSVNAETWLITAAMGLMGFAIMRGIFAFSQAYNAERTSQSVAFDMRNELFAKIQRLSFSYHDQTQTGQLMIRATDDVEKVRLFVGQGLMMALQAFILLIGTLIVLLFTNFQLTLAVLPTLPVALVLFMGFSAVAQPLFMQVQIRLSKLNTILQENLAGIKVVKAFVREVNEQKRFNAAAQDLMQQHLLVARVFSFLFPFIFLIMNLGQAAVLYFGGRQILEGTLTIGEWQKFSLYLIYVFFPLGQLGMIISQMAQAGASATRIFEVIDAKNDVIDKPNAIALPPIQGQVVFDNVTFRYFGSDDPVLSKVSLDAKPGETIALLGATGSGKTTIINLLPRFYDASEGHILIDGHDVRDVKIDSLRSQIGIVLQDTTLFSGTIRDNIAFGRPEATMDQVIAAAKAAVAHDFIMSFPNGYDTQVGERGTTLSGGQKQRVAIARALLLSPRILILDDSTSSVDLATEYKIQKALDELMKGRTSFVIAQRISTVLNADQILVLDKGQIVARGTHEELLEESEIYAEIYNSQLVGDAEIVEPTITGNGQEAK